MAEKRTFIKDGTTYKIIPTKQTDNKGRKIVGGTFEKDGVVREVRFYEVEGQSITEKHLEEATNGIMADPDLKDNQERYQSNL